MLEIVSQTDLPFQLSELRDHCRVTDASYNPALTRSLNAAAVLIERWAGVYLRATTIDSYFMGVPEPYRFDYGPVTSLTSVTKVSDSSTIAATAYELDKTKAWPCLRSLDTSAWTWNETYKVRWVAGYTSVPEPLKIATFELAALHFENREAATPVKLHALPMALESIISAYGPRGM